MLVLHRRIGTGALEEEFPLVVVPVGRQQAGSSPGVDRSRADAESLGDLMPVEQAASAEPRVPILEPVLVSESS